MLPNITHNLNKMASAAEQLAVELSVFATWRDDYTGTLSRSAAELLRLNSENAALRAERQGEAELEFDDCAESPTGKHSESWFSNDNCEYCNTGEVSAPLYYAPSEMQLTPQEQEHVATVQCVRGVTIGYLEKMLPVGTKLYTAQPAQQPLTDEPPAVGSITELG